MKRIYIIGILLCMTVMLSSVGYAAGAPAAKKAFYGQDIGLEVMNNAHNDLLAQVIMPSSQDQTIKIDDIIVKASSSLNIPIDTVNNINEIVTKGAYYIEHPPGKGATPVAWAGYITGIIGLIFGAIYYFKHRSLEKQVSSS